MSRKLWPCFGRFSAVTQDEPINAGLIQNSPADEGWQMGIMIADNPMPVALRRQVQQNCARVSGHAVGPCIIMEIVAKAPDFART